MSGVILGDGVQWERCNGCGKYCRLDEMRYEKPSTEHKHGRDMCPRCLPDQAPAGGIVVSL